MNSREQFEMFYCESHQIPLETFSQYRMGESYREPMIAKCWRFWKASRESIEIDLPAKISAHNMMANGHVRTEAEHYDEAIDDCRSSIEAYGLKVKS